VGRNPKELEKKIELIYRVKKLEEGQIPINRRR